MEDKAQSDKNISDLAEEAVSAIKDELRPMLQKFRNETKLDKAEALLDLVEELTLDLSTANHGDKIKERSIVEIAHLQKRFQNLDERAKGIKARFYKVFDFIRCAVIPDRMEEEGIDGSMKITGLGRLGLTSDVSATIPASNKAEAYEWLGDHGHGDLIQQTVNAGSLKALAKSKLRDNDPLPDNLFKVTPFSRASITKT